MIPMVSIDTDSSIKSIFILNKRKMLLNGNTSAGAFFNFMVVVFCIVLCFFAFYMDVF